MEAYNEIEFVSIFFPVAGTHFSRGDENTTSKPDSMRTSTRKLFAAFEYTSRMQWKNKRSTASLIISKNIYQKVVYVRFVIHYLTQTIVLQRD